MKRPAPDHCPCGAGVSYGDCCGRFHQGNAAPTAELLMRSRYVAYALGLWHYLGETWHASTRPADWSTDQAGVSWLGLSVRACECRDDDHATVEFIARYKVNGRAFRLHEISRFVREGGRWFYVDGRFPDT